MFIIMTCIWPLLRSCVRLIGIIELAEILLISRDNFCLWMLDIYFNIFLNFIIYTPSLAAWAFISCSPLIFIIVINQPHLFLEGSWITDSTKFLSQLIIAWSFLVNLAAFLFLLLHIGLSIFVVWNQIRSFRKGLFFQFSLSVIHFIGLIRFIPWYNQSRIGTSRWLLHHCSGRFIGFWFWRGFTWRLLAFLIDWLIVILVVILNIMNLLIIKSIDKIFFLFFFLITTTHLIIAISLIL